MFFNLFSADGFVSGLDGFVMSVGVIIAIIISVVVLITIFAVVIVCCCCKTVRNHFDHSKGTKAKRSSELQGCSSTSGQRPTPSGKAWKKYSGSRYLYCNAFLNLMSVEFCFALASSYFSCYTYFHIFCSFHFFLFCMNLIHTTMNKLTSW